MQVNLPRGRGAKTGGRGNAKTKNVRRFWRLPLRISKLVRPISPSRKPAIEDLHG